MFKMFKMFKILSESLKEVLSIFIAPGLLFVKDITDYSDRVYGSPPPLLYKIFVYITV